ncbi:type IV conjugative transfer system protein TraL (plasmid) [Diaphorobacter sp. HDW4A]|jgi:conjugal transfer pilus assembly protein TraL|uniref:type IV conjugative transfer system protein TraL n=1 Tax=Diaphorobacter sp. HDW4A TaxID=2714924 RepID=UPI00140A0FB0|nr:type IV conjugative transfer system protein TraL [Diaphorobacter sp. HDW4A]QIL84346.1 type IV conjugative transfer system protein TraL [Diaphorobacter sp. HDW4A]
MTEMPIPNYVDDQMQVFFWEVDEFFPALIIFVVMFMWDQLLLGLVATLIFVKLFGRFKSNHMAGVLFHMVWWSGVMALNKKFDNGSVREIAK